MLKLLAAFFATVLMVQTGMFAEPGLSPETEKHLANSNANTLLLTEEPAAFATDTESDVLPSETNKPINIQRTESGEYVIFGNDILLNNGIYSYELRIRPDKTLTFNNDLEIYSQGVSGNYSLYYELDEANNHTMTINGLFKNIITASPLLELLSADDKDQILSNVSKDIYYYRLDLKTNEGFSFFNLLSLFSGSDRYGYSLNFNYDVLTNEQTLVMTDLSDGSKTELI